MRKVILARVMILSLGSLIAATSWAKTGDPARLLQEARLKIAQDHGSGERNPDVVRYEECVLESTATWTTGKTSRQSESVADAVNRLCTPALRNLFFSDSSLPASIDSDRIAELLRAGDFAYSSRSHSEDEMKRMFTVYPQYADYKLINSQNAPKYYAFLASEKKRVADVAKSLGF